MLMEWEKEHPGRIDTIARALTDIRPSQLGDPKLFDFLSLGRRSNAPLPDAHAWLAGNPPATPTSAPTPDAEAGLDRLDGLDILSR